MMSARFWFFIICLSQISLAFAEDKKKRKLSPGVVEVQHTPSVFKPDPQYGKHVYDARQQWLIYGGKKAVKTPRPLLELGRQFLTGGPYKPGLPGHFIVYGDVRLPAVSSYAAGQGEDDDQNQLVAALQLNLEADWKITSTTRIHFLLQPLQSNLEGVPTTSRFSSGIKDKDDEMEVVYAFQRCVDEGCNFSEAIDELGTFFLEGDLGATLNADVDLPYTFGKIPMILQNGVWVEDAFLGGAFSFTAKNSPSLGISNFDVTFFGGFDGVDTRVSALNNQDPPRSDDVLGTDLIDNTNGMNRSNDLSTDSAASMNDSSGQPHRFAILAMNVFADAGQGYWELGYGYALDRDANEAFDLSYHNLTLAFTRRYFDRWSNSIRLIGNLGQAEERTANGFAILVENSLVTHLPSTLVPYLNLFAGFDRPQPLAKATGLLRNTGLAYEADIFTLFPSLNDNVHDVAGGALGVEYLFNLDQQIVLEAAVSIGLCTVKEDRECARIGPQHEVGLALRHQLPFAGAWLLRTDGLLGIKDPTESNSQTFAGLRVELRRKF